MASDQCTHVPANQDNGFVREVTVNLQPNNQIISEVYSKVSILYIRLMLNGIISQSSGSLSDLHPRNPHLDDLPPDGADKVLQTLSDADVRAAAHVSAYGNDLTKKSCYLFSFDSNGGNQCRCFL